MQPRSRADETAQATERLAAFLAGHNATIDRLRAHVGDALGEPLLVVAAGSVVHGFGNRRSDIDLNVVVGRSSLPMAPVLSFEGNLLHDVTYFAPQDVRGWPAVMRDQRWPAPGPVSRADWRRRENELFHCVRIGYGVILLARDGWNEWVDQLTRPWLRERIAEWWELEIARCWVASRWLRASKPLLAAQRCSDALLAKLQVRAVKAGELYFKAKWLPEKLRRLDDGVGLGALTEALKLPASAAEAAEHAARCEVMLEKFAGLPLPEDLRAQLWLAPGVKVRAFDRRTVVSRWDLRTVELSGTPLPDAALVWEGEITEALGSPLAELFGHDMLWLSIARAA
jgi:hypothetical protein